MCQSVDKRCSVLVFVLVRESERERERREREFRFCTTMSDFRFSQEEPSSKGAQQQQQLTGIQSLSARPVNNFPSHFDLLSPRSMGIFGASDPPDSPPDAMDLARPEFPEFESRQQPEAFASPRSSLRSVRPPHQQQQQQQQQLQPQQVPMAQKSAEFLPDAVQNLLLAPGNVDRRIVLEKRASSTSSPPSNSSVPPVSGNNLSVQENSIAGTSPAGSGTQTSPVKVNGESNKLSPQELERIRINRASEYYRLQREKFNEMNQTVQHAMEAALSPSSPPPTQLAAARPNLQTPTKPLSTTATLRASRIVKSRQQQNSNLPPGDQTAPAAPTRGQHKPLFIIALTGMYYMAQAVLR